MRAAGISKKKERSKSKGRLLLGKWETAGLEREMDFARKAKARFR